MIDVALYESVFNVMESLAHRGLDRRRMKVGSFALLSHAVLNSVETRTQLRTSFELR